MNRFLELVFLELIGTLGHILTWYICCCSLRIYLNYFPNINVYYQPMTSLRYITDPYFGFWAGVFPDTPMIDFSTILAFLTLDMVRDWCFLVTSRNQIILPEAIKQVIHFAQTINMYLDGLIDKVFPG